METQKFKLARAICSCTVCTNKRTQIWDQLKKENLLPQINSEEVSKTAIT